MYDTTILAHITTCVRTVWCGGSNMIGYYMYSILLLQRQRTSFRGKPERAKGKSSEYMEQRAEIWLNSFGPIASVPELSLRTVHDGGVDSIRLVPNKWINKLNSS